MIDDLERYAEIAAALAASDDRGAVLTGYGLSEEEWDVIDAEWQDRLSSAVTDYDGDGVPDLVARFSEVYGRARERFTVDVISFEKFVEITRAVHRTHDIMRALSSHGLTFAAYARANQHWTVRIARDPALAEQLRRALSG